MFYHLLILFAGYGLCFFQPMYTPHLMEGVNQIWNFACSKDCLIGIKALMHLFSLFRGAYLYWYRLYGITELLISIQTRLTIDLPQYFVDYYQNIRRSTTVVDQSGTLTVPETPDQIQTDEVKI